MRRVSARAGNPKPLLAIVLGGHYHSRYRGRVLEEKLPAKAPDGVLQDRWEYVLAAQKAACDAATVVERRRALSDFWEAVTHLPPVDFPDVPPGIPLAVRSALMFSGPREGIADDELAAAWARVKDEPTRMSPRAWDESTYAHWRFVVGLEPEAAYEAARAESDLRSAAAEREKIREYGVAVWHPYWADTPIEERHRRVAEAYEEVGQPVPEEALVDSRK